MTKLNPFRFSTEYDDDETDLLYYGYRCYNPSTGRWSSRDPIAEKGGNNLYAFCKNDSIDIMDRLGLDSLQFQQNQCQGCNPDSASQMRNTCYGNPAGKWVSGSSGSFNTSCIKNGSGSVCDTETHVKIQVGRSLFSCCKTWNISCKFEYNGTLVGDARSFIVVSYSFLGTSGYLTSPSPGSSGTISASWNFTKTGVASVPYFGWTTIATLVPENVVTGSLWEKINESGSVSCTATCAN